MWQDGEDGITKPDYRRKLFWLDVFRFGLGTIGKEDLLRCLKLEVKMIQKKRRVIKMVNGVVKSQPSLYRIL